MFDLLFGKNKASVVPTNVPTIVSYDTEGMHYHLPADTGTQWLKTPFALDDAADLFARLDQIFLDGFGERRETEFVLPWRDVYSLLQHPELASYRDALLIPPTSQARPRLISKGALMDADFSVFLDEWVDPQGRRIEPAPKQLGCVLEVAGTCTLLPEPLHRLLDELGRFHACAPEQRTQSFKEQSFGRMRMLASRSGCPVSDYVLRTVVLTPERLRLSMERRGQADDALLEVIPGFDDAPVGWLNQFDRLPLQDSYDVPDGPALVRVVISPEVRAVLTEIKRMPGRRAYGPRAQAFVRNPFGVLGEAALGVIDADQFEKARTDAGIHFERFSPQVQRGEAGEVLCVGLHIEAPGNPLQAAQTQWFTDIAELQRFTDKLGRCLTDGSQCIHWHGHELDIEGDTPTHLVELETWWREWASAGIWTATEVLDVRHYAERIEGIGIEKPFITPVIARNDSAQNWFESNVSIGLRVQDPTSEQTVMVPLVFDDIPSLQQAVLNADRAHLPTVQLPGLKMPVPIADARNAVDALVRAQAELKSKTFKPSVNAEKSTPLPPKRLLIKRNLEDIDYSEVRADALQMPDDREPVLPLALRPDVILKPHQCVGVAWLQHLWQASPDHCRGTVLADDMGLGKTLQLLTFITSCFEADPALPPALVVAPVALLENWRNELGRFFQPADLPGISPKRHYFWTIPSKKPFTRVNHPPQYATISRQVSSTPDP